MLCLTAHRRYDKLNDISSGRIKQAGDADFRGFEYFFHFFIIFFFAEKCGACLF
jgi:hypothetical protein